MSLRLLKSEVLTANLTSVYSDGKFTSRQKTLIRHWVTRIQDMLLGNTSGVKTSLNGVPYRGG